MKIVQLLFLVFFIAQNACGAVGFEDANFPELATSGRALAMGNAFVAKVDDSASSFYNPAGLGTVRYKHLHLSNFHLETNKGFYDMGAGGNISELGGDLGKSFSADGARQLLLKNPGSISYGRLQAMPNFTKRFFSLGYLLSKRSKMALGKLNNAQFEYADRLDHGPYLSLNLSLFGGVIKFGATGVYLNRKEGIGEAPASQSFTLDDNRLNKGHAFLVISGGKFTLPVAFLPTVAATVHNSTSQQFSHDGGIAAPAKIPQTLDLGFSLTPKFSRNSQVHLEYNLRDSRQKYGNVSNARRNLFGLEFDFGRLVFVRFGYADGFGSAGLGIKSRKVELDLTTYAVDTTTSEFRGQEDRRFSLTLSSGF